MTAATLRDSGNLTLVCVPGSGPMERVGMWVCGQVGEAKRSRELSTYPSYPHAGSLVPRSRNLLNKMKFIHLREKKITFELNE